MAAKKIPFRFVVDYLATVDVEIKPMFGMFALYVNEKIMLILRERKNNSKKNGVWIATKPEHHKSLKADLPSMDSISDFSSSKKKESEWQILPSSADDFEASVIKVCSMIVKRDPRIGRISEGKRSKV